MDNEDPTGDLVDELYLKRGNSLTKEECQLFIDKVIAVSFVSTLKEYKKQMTDLINELEKDILGFDINLQ